MEAIFYLNTPPMLSSAHALNDTPLNEHVVEESVVEAEPLEI